MYTHIDVHVYKYIYMHTYTYTTHTYVHIYKLVLGMQFTWQCLPNMLKALNSVPSTA